MKQHFHPVYHLQFMNDIGEDTFGDYSFTIDVSHSAIRGTDLTTCFLLMQMFPSIKTDGICLLGMPHLAYEGEVHAIFPVWLI